MFYRLWLAAMFMAFFMGSTVNASDPADEAGLISPLLVGSQIPVISLTSKDGQPVDLAKAAGEKPVILVFYRGGW